MRLPVFTLIVSAGVSAAVAGQVEHRALANASPRPLPAMALSRDEVESFMDGLLATQLRTKPAAGAAVAVVKDGAVLLLKGYGYEDVDERVPVDPRYTLFRPGSISKLFTWTAVMQLVEQGRLDLDRDVNTYLKEFRIPQTYPHPITLRNLMTHTAGLEEGIFHMLAPAPKDFVPLGTFLKEHMPARVRPPTVDFSSGVDASYSNWGTSLAGHIVETVSGVPFDAYVEQRIFSPLGMAHSTFREPPPSAIARRVSRSYAFEAGALTPQEPQLYHNVAPAGSLSSTAGDMARFMLAYLQEGAVADARILEPETVRSMWTRTLSPDPALDGLALGFMEEWINGRRTLGHGGDTGYFHSMLKLVPEANLGIFVSFNTNDAGPAAVEVADEFVKHYFPARLPAIEPPKNAAERNARYVGTYRTLRHSYTTYEKAFGIFGGTEIEAMPDGTLLIPLDDVPARWVEVADGVFRKTDDSAFLAFKGDGAGAMHMVGPFTAIAAERIGWYETGSFHKLLLAIAALLFATMTISAVRKRRVDRAGPPNLRWARSVLATAGVLLIASWVAIAAAFLLNGKSLVFEIPKALSIGLTLAMLSLLPLAAACYYLLAVLRSRAWPWGTRLHYAVTLMAAGALLWLLNYWNLLGYRYP